MSLLLAAVVGLPFLVAIGVLLFSAVAAGRARRRRAEKRAMPTPHRGGRNV